MIDIPPIMLGLAKNAAHSAKRHGDMQKFRETGCDEIIFAVISNFKNLPNVKFNNTEDASAQETNTARLMISAFMEAMDVRETLHIDTYSKMILKLKQTAEASLALIQLACTVLQAFLGKDHPVGSVINNFFEQMKKDISVTQASTLPFADQANGTASAIGKADAPPCPTPARF